MAKQNIYDDPIFFDGYMKIREKEDNANDLFEIPALLSLLPDLSGKSLLDLGCGYGEHCKMFINMGAANVVGVDLNKALVDKYGEGCPGCGKLVCECPNSEKP